MSIKLLPLQISARIAAGEVVERPVSVVKELIENSLDAKATKIKISLSNGGIDSIEISDNGVGVPYDEAGLVFERFATSKIEHIDDLDHISSLGFRGEAVFSIAAISRVELITKTHESDIGTHIIVQDGEFLSQSPIAANTGTIFKVIGLFNNFPARRKFLGSPLAESRRILSLIKKYSIIRPDVSFEYHQLNSRSFVTSGSGDIRDVMVEIYGRDIANDMLILDKSEFEEIYPGTIVEGIVSNPTQNKSNRSHINLFVNERLIQSKSLSYSFEQAYHGFIAERKFPFGMLNISIPFDDVDVNVHPAKTEVLFHKENLIFSLIQKSIRNTLLEKMPVLDVTFDNNDLYMTDNEDGIQSIDSRNNNIFETPTLDLTDRIGASNSDSSYTPKNVLPLLRVIGQISKTYIVCEGPESLYVIDQHAAHERIVFENVINRYANNDPDVQKLLEPIVVDLDDMQMETIEKNEEIFNILGMEIESFGDSTYIIRSIPHVLATQNPVRAFKNMIAVLEEGKHFETWEEKAAYSIACHGAIRAGKSLSLLEMETLIKQLENCHQPNNCPHGRPTLFSIDNNNLAKRFRRT
ncbi:MAG: DNA mismatch repair endonuclease MutL [Dehalococcoidia bacterium]